MQMRTMGNNPTKSVRMSKEEWEAIKAEGDTMFNNRNVGYMQVRETDIVFDVESPYFKDFKSLDIIDKLKSPKQEKKDKLIMNEIKNKGGQL